MMPFRIYCLFFLPTLACYFKAGANPLPRFVQLLTLCVVSLPAVLRVSPNDADALRCKLIALIHTSAYEDALTVMQSANLAAEYGYERSYCLYRLGKLEEALSALESVGEDNAAAALQLKAQLHFRLGNSKSCIQVSLPWRGQVDACPC